MNFLDNFQTPSFVFQKEYLLFINKYFLKGPLGVISWKKTQQVVIDLFPRKASVWVWLFFNWAADFMDFYDIVFTSNLEIV